MGINKYETFRTNPFSTIHVYRLHVFDKLLITVFEITVLQNFSCAMLCKHVLGYAVMQCPSVRPSVCPSVTFEMSNRIFKIFFTIR